MGKQQTQLMNNLKKFIKSNMNQISKSNRVASYATQALRKEVLLKSYNDLYSMGFKLPDFTNIKEKHVIALGHQWEAEGLSAKTIANRISVFRTFSHAIGKPGLIKDTKDYVKNPASIQRTNVAKTDKTWSGNGVDALKKTEQIYAQDARVGTLLMLQLAFGLRMKESALIRPHQADRDKVLMVSHGAKGGRDRFVVIENEFQRAVLDHAKSITARNQSMIPTVYSYKQWRNHYYHVIRSNGISRKDGITSHGLRHERLNEVYKQITGHNSKVKGGEVTNKEMDTFARSIVAQIAGHGRDEVASTYLGGKR